jgi:Helix-turn-helix domain
MSKVMVLSAGSTIGPVCETSVNRLEHAGLSVRLRQFNSLAEIKWHGSRHTKTIIVSEFSALQVRHPLKVRLPKQAKHLVFKRADDPLEAMPASMNNLHVRDPKRLHIATRRSDEEAEALIFRTICGLAGNHSDRIVDAWWEGDEFVVLTPEFDRFPIDARRLSPILGRDKQKRSQFEIDPDGSYVYWPHADVHLGWEQFVCLVDPESGAALRSLRSTFNRNYGARIRAIREESRLRQSDVAGLTPRQVGRIESGECRATRSALEKLAHAHNRPLVDYLRTLADGGS